MSSRLMSERSDCWKSYEAQDGFISFARNGTVWLSRAGLGCVVSYAVAMAIASVRERDRGSIGGSLEKLCGDGLMKSGSDMSQSHRLRMVECQGRNRAERVQPVQKVGDGNVRICPAALPACLHVREWPHSPTPGKPGHQVWRDRPLLLPPFTRVQRYIGRSLTAHHSTTVRYFAAMTGPDVLDCGQSGVQR